MEFPISKNLDFTEKWINSIEKEVLRGVKVRDEKLKCNPSNSIYQCDLIDIDVTKPSCSKSYGSSQLQRPLKSRKNDNSRRSVSPQKRKKRYKKCEKNERNKRSKRCGMRIAELAVPSQRHCIETWRSRWDTLPTLMVDRLRQIVMGQKPIVPIKDAIICFKQKKTNISRSPYKGHKTVESKKTKEIKILCGIFGFIISSKLQAPRNVTLGSGLIPIAHIVNDEISHLLIKSKKSNIQKNIQLEITNKITNWIAEILEQATYNLMLDDYIELEKQEGHIWDIIDELVDNVALPCKDLSSTSSDVIGAESSYSNPSLINIGETDSDHSDENNLVVFENIIWNIIEKIPSYDNKTRDMDTTSLENLNVMEEYSPKTSSENIEDYFKNFLSSHIDEITLNAEEEFEDAIHFDVSNSEPIDKSIPNDEIQNTIEENSDEQNNEIIIESNISNDFNEDNNEETLAKDSLKIEAEEDSSSIDNNRSSDIMRHNFNAENIHKDSSDKIDVKDTITWLPYDKEGKMEVSTDNAINNENNIIEETNIKVDETMPLTDITSYDSIKKVKYSNMDPGQGQLNIKSNIRDEEHKKSGIHGIHFAPPNDNLLSDADESWPENLRFPTVKATVSISKSVLSLGKINEDEEKTRDPDSVNEVDTKASYVEEDGKLKNNNNKRNILIKINLSNENIVDENLTNNDPVSEIKDIIDTGNVQLDRKEVQKIFNKNLIKNDKSSVVDDILNTSNVKKAGEIGQKIISAVLLENNMQLVDKNLIDRSTSQEVGDGLVDIKNKAIQTTKKNNKRGLVNLAVEHLPVIFICPEIYPQNIQSLGKAKEDKTTQIKPDENCQYIQPEVRFWCQGLQNVILNLDMWLDWIDNTCSNLLHLKQKEKCQCNRKIQEYNNRKWIILKMNIDSDVRLWEKLSIGLQVGLRSYKYFYQQPEVRRLMKVIHTTSTFT